MDATISIRTPKDLKVDFKQYCDNLGIEPSKLIRRFMSGCLDRGDGVKVDIDIDEVIFEDAIDNVIKSKKSQEMLSLLSDKVKEIG